MACKHMETRADRKTAIAVVFLDWCSQKRKPCNYCVGKEDDNDGNNYNRNDMPDNCLHN